MGCPNPVKVKTSIFNSGSSGAPHPAYATALTAPFPLQVLHLVHFPTSMSTYSLSSILKTNSLSDTRSAFSDTYLILNGKRQLFLKIYANVLHKVSHYSYSITVYVGNNSVITL